MESNRLPMVLSLEFKAVVMKQGPSEFEVAQLESLVVSKSLDSVNTDNCIRQ